MGCLPNQKRRKRVATLRAEGLTFAEVGRRLGVSKQAAWPMLTRHPAADAFTVCCAACRAIVTTRCFQRRTVGEVFCRDCLAARLGASFALRLWSYRLAAGLSRTEVEEAAGLVTGAVKNFEERGVKPHAATRARLAKVLRAPDLERFGD